LEKRFLVTEEVESSNLFNPAIMTICCTCRLPKDDSEFATKDRKTGRKNGRCKLCQSEYGKEHYRLNKAEYVVRIADYKRSVGAALREAKSKPCLDCGGYFPYYVMQFDHRGNKDFCISANRANYGLVRLLEEVAKCDVVCSNCHAIRTFKRREANEL
jgi:hypothetical protein